jgi:phosphoribosylformylglycinamidine cyclo-ligase
MPDPSKYELRGVSAGKEDVHKAIRNLDKGLFPMAFCKVLPDVVGGSRSHCNIMHADTAGTKTSLAYLYWKESGDISVWEGIAQDAIVMNTDDMACTGCINDILLSSTIGRNKHLITGDVIATIIQSAASFVEKMSQYGISIKLAGGETADVGDIVRTVDVGYTTFARMKREDVIVNHIRPGNVIIGLASDGQASYEDEYNSGIGSNGLTSARHDLLAKKYLEKYPESCNPGTNAEYLYSGSLDLLQEVEINGQNFSIGNLLLSPTRTYLPVLVPILREYQASIGGMIHNTGGGHSKVLKFVGDHIRIIKDQLFEPPPIFKLIAEESKASAEEMYKVFNMGCRLEIYVEPDKAEEIMDVIGAFNIETKIIGRVERGEKSVEIHLTDGERVIYRD